jgi:hypothetical protein
MEIVLTILVVTLLVILPALFLVLMLGGLVDAVRRALFDSKHNKQTRPPALGLYPTPGGSAEPPLE